MKLAEVIVGANSTVERAQIKAVLRPKIGRSGCDHNARLGFKNFEVVMQKTRTSGSDRLSLVVDDELVVPVFNLRLGLLEVALGDWRATKRVAWPSARALAW